VSKLRALINGCSFSRGPLAWPYFLDTVDQTNIVNLACAGAGNTYIHETTVNAVAQRNYDIVLVMWSGIERVDLKISHPEVFGLSTCTSRYQRRQNDWLEKITTPFDDQQLVESDWIFGAGHYNGDAVMHESGVFDGIYRYQEQPQFRYGLLQKIIALQNTLKNVNVPYVFMFYQNYISELHLDQHLCKLVDWNNCFVDGNIYDIATTNNWFDHDGFHPGIDANQLWAEKLDNFIKEKYA